MKIRGLYLSSLAAFAVTALGGLALTGCGKKEEPAVNTPYDKSQLPPGASYDQQQQMMNKLGKGKKDGDEGKKGGDEGKKGGDE